MPRGKYNRTGIKRGPYKFSEKRAESAYKKWQEFEDTHTVFDEYSDMSEGRFKYLYKKSGSDLSQMKDDATHRTSIHTMKAINKDLIQDYLKSSEKINRATESTHDWLDRLKSSNFDAYNKIKNDISWVYKQARAEGMDAANAKMIVSQWFFGS